MSKFTIGIFSLLLSGLPLLSWGALKDVDATKENALQATVLIEAGDLLGAFEAVKINWPLPASEINNLLATTLQQRTQVAERFGKTVGMEFIRTDTAGNSLIRHVFLEKFEKHAIRWEFIYYKPADEWLVNSVYWDDEIENLFLS